MSPFFKETLAEYKTRIASSGGIAVAAKYGKKHMTKIGKKGLKKRWKKKSKIQTLLFD